MTQAAARIGVFGGAFDPPHKAHVALALAAVEQLGLDQLRVIPTGHAWHKPRALSAALHRIAMARLAFDEVTRVVVDERETLRVGPSYTIDTLRELQAEHPQAQLFLLLGQDQAKALPNWHRSQDIPALAIICVAERGAAVPCSSEFCHTFDVPEPTPGCFQRLILPPLCVGSTQIRARVAAGQGIADLVPEPVARYIAHHHLYLNP